jgi:hypothetical protein
VGYLLDTVAARQTDTAAEFGFRLAVEDLWFQILVLRRQRSVRSALQAWGLADGEKFRNSKLHHFLSQNESKFATEGNG